MSPETFNSRLICHLENTHMETARQLIFRENDLEKALWEKEQMSKWRDACFMKLRDAGVSYPDFEWKDYPRD
jgi:hypothetical protein